MATAPFAQRSQIEVDGFHPDLIDNEEKKRRKELKNKSEE